MKTQSKEEITQEPWINAIIRLARKNRLLKEAVPPRKVAPPIIQNERDNPA